jgi:site-specific recombinase XerD
MKKPPVPRPRQEILQSYQQHLREVAGLSPKTCRNHARDVSQFLEAVPIRRATELSKLTPVELTSYLTGRSADYQPASLRQVAGSLRQFLNFAQQQGWTNRPLSLAVPSIASPARNDLPAYLNRQQLDLLLNSWDRRTAQGQRDFAIGLCLARLGMRAGEVAALRLEHLDWRQGVLRLTHSKNGHFGTLPLLREVGENIANYLRAGRPACSYRQVFLSHQPVRPMNGQAISQVIRRALNSCGIEVPRPGAHLLRHTLASHLVQNGASLKEVADLLRHRHLNSAAVYAHVDVAGLRSVAQPWFKGVRL